MNAKPGNIKMLKVSIIALALLFISCAEKKTSSLFLSEETLEALLDPLVRIPGEDMDAAYIYLSKQNARFDSLNIKFDLLTLRVGEINVKIDTLTALRRAEALKWRQVND